MKVSSPDGVKVNNVDSKEEIGTHAEPFFPSCRRLALTFQKLTVPSLSLSLKTTSPRSTTSRRERAPRSGSRRARRGPCARMKSTGEDLRVDVGHSFFSFLFSPAAAAAARGPSLFLSKPLRFPVSRPPSFCRPIISLPFPLYLVLENDRNKKSQQKNTLAAASSSSRTSASRPRPTGSSSRPTASSSSRRERTLPECACTSSRSCR